MGVLGRDRVFLVKRRDAKINLPSDFLGITTADYVNPPDKKAWEAAMNYAGSAISDLIKQRGLRSSAQKLASSSQAHIKDAAQYFDKLLVERYGVSALFSGVNLAVTSLDGSATANAAGNQGYGPDKD